MSGQTNVYSAKKKIVDEYVKKYSPFEKKEGLDFDLRGYSTYVKTHNLEAKEITPDIMNMFEQKAEIS